MQYTLQLSLSETKRRGGGKVVRARDSGSLLLDIVPRHNRENASVKSHQYGYLNKNRIMASDDMTV